MIIKVCGMREAENIRAVEYTGIQWMGFIFYPPSPRYVSERPDYMPESVQRIGVFVNDSVENIIRTVLDFGLHAVQLHGKESPEFCKELLDAFQRNHAYQSIFNWRKEGVGTNGSLRTILPVFPLRYTLPGLWRLRTKLQLEYPFRLQGSYTFLIKRGTFIQAAPRTQRIYASAMGRYRPQQWFRKTSGL